MSHFPQHQGTLFLGVMNLVPATKYTSETSTSSRRWYQMVDFFFLLSVPRLFTTNIPEKCYGVFSNCGWYYFNKPFLRAAFESPWDLRRRTFSDLKEKKWLIGRKPSPGRHREFRHLWNPSIRFYKKLKNVSCKKQGGKRFPSQFHRSNFFQNFYEKRN